MGHREAGRVPVGALHPSPCVLLAGAPGPPGVPIIVRYSSAIAIHWSSGDPGKGPVTRYVIEARPSGTRPAVPLEPASPFPLLPGSLHLVHLCHRHLRWHVGFSR